MLINVWFNKTAATTSLIFMVQKYGKKLTTYIRHINDGAWLQHLLGSLITIIKYHMSFMTQISLFMVILFDDS